MGERGRVVAAEEEGGPVSPGFVRNQASKDRSARFTLAHAFSCAWSGVVVSVRTQRNMKIHLAAAAVAVAAGLVLGIDAVSWAVVTLCIAAVVSAECLNTALESVVDLVSPEYHELAGRAKDAAAGAVLVLAAASVAVAAFVFVPRLAALLAP
ncbi:diacylglycerol kinase family protein [Rubneribacter sp.]|nr:diacylglycerol kinase family protein [Candidatus Rubneribacter avistercoris]